MEASEPVVAMLGLRAEVAATFGGIGFHERGMRRHVEEAVQMEKQISEKREMGKIRDPLADGGQGKSCWTLLEIHERARRKRKAQKDEVAESQMSNVPALKPLYEEPDDRPAPAFHPIQRPVIQPVQVPTKPASETTTVQMPQQRAPQPVQVPTEKAAAIKPVQVPQKIAPAVAEVRVPTEPVAPMTVQVQPARVQVQQQLAPTGEEEKFVGLKPPTLESGAQIDGTNKRQLRQENKQRRIRKQEEQEESSYWSHYKGEFVMPPQLKGLEEWRGSMCPSNLALHHPAAGKLLQYATGGCPCNTGKPWSKQQMWAAVERRPHVLALQQEAITQLKGEIAEKVRVGQCRVVEWDEIKDNPPAQLKISPLAMNPHKSRQFRAILDLSFKIRLKTGETIPSVNETTMLEAPAGAIDQLGQSLQRIIHAFAEADEDAKIFMAKFDIKDGFWRLECAAGEEGTLLILCFASGGRRAGSASGTNFASNGMGGITTVFLRRQRDGV
jgi:hypothetical protein